MAQAVKLPPEVTVVVGILALGTVVGTVVLVRHWVVKAEEKREEKEKAKEDVEEIANEVVAYQEAGMQRTLTPSQITAIADAIETATIGPWYDPTDEDTIYESFGQLGNNVDFLNLSAEYAASKGETLQTAISGDMNAKERKQVNTILAGKQITYRV